jgi:hypothetical protein
VRQGEHNKKRWNKLFEKQHRERLDLLENLMEELGHFEQYLKIGIRSEQLPFSGR